MPFEIEVVAGDALADAVTSMLPREPFLAYGNFPPISDRDGALFDLHRNHWCVSGDDIEVLAARDQAGQIAALLRMTPRPFESQHFGMPMAAIEAPLAVASDDDRLPALAALYEQAAIRAKARGYAHLATAVSTSDRAGAWAVQSNGAFHVGTRISWLQPLTGAACDSRLEPGLRVEEFTRDRLRHLPRASWQRLREWTAQAFDRGPYVLDLSVPLDLARRVYQVWTEKALSGEWADWVLVIWDGDEVVAFHTMLLLPELSRAANVPIVGRGIGGTMPGYRGLFTAMQLECSRRQPLGASYLENEAQASTIASIQVFGKLGHRCIRSSASFHQRLDRQTR